MLATINRAILFLVYVTAYQFNNQYTSFMCLYSNKELCICIQRFDVIYLFLKSLHCQETSQTFLNV